jgi:LysM repeat protein
MHPLKLPSISVVLLVLSMAAAGTALAQDTSASSSGTVAHGTYAPALPPGSVVPSGVVPSAPSASYAQTAPNADPPQDASDTGSTSASAGEAKASRTHKFFPYTVRSGDSLGTVAQYFGVSTADLVRVNKMHEDDELQAGQTLKIPNPFEAAHRALEAQVQQLTEQNHTSEQKAQQADAQVASLTSSNSDLTAQNATLKESVKILPWWRGTALAVGAAALLMLGVTALTLFEWWMLRRRFLALSDLAMSLSRLDVKYKETIAKAELRMQQLYGRRRPAGAPENLLGGMKTPDEIEVERLSHELRETLERHLEQLGVRGRASIGARWRNVLGGQEEPSPEPRPYRR